MREVQEHYLARLPIAAEARLTLSRQIGNGRSGGAVSASDAVALLGEIDRLFRPANPSAWFHRRRDQIALMLSIDMPPTQRLLLMLRDPATASAYLRAKAASPWKRWRSRSALGSLARAARRKIVKDGGSCEPDLRVYGDAGGVGRVSFGRQTIVEHGCSLWLSGEAQGGEGRLSCGDYLFLGFNTRINVYADVTIGRQVSIGANTYITSCNHRFESRKVPIQMQGFVGAPVSIGDDAWLGCNVVVLRVRASDVGPSLGRAAS